MTGDRLGHGFVASRIRAGFVLAIITAVGLAPAACPGCGPPAEVGTVGVPRPIGPDGKPIPPKPKGGLEAPPKTPPKAKAAAKDDGKK